jgi:group I intron endonuclease
MLIYKIQNKINGKIYIGQTSQSLNRRISRHIHDNKTPIQKAITKYGIGSFDISIIDYADSTDVLNEKESYWISFFNCKPPFGYNLSDGGEHGLRGRKLTAEHIRKITIASTGRLHTQEAKNKISNTHKGMKASNETRAKMSDRMKGNPSPMRGKHHTEEAKEKLSVAAKGRKLSRQHKEKIGTGSRKAWENRRVNNTASWGKKRNAG